MDLRRFKSCLTTSLENVPVTLRASGDCRCGKASGKTMTQVENIRSSRIGERPEETRRRRSDILGQSALLYGKLEGETDDGDL